MPTGDPARSVQLPPSRSPGRRSRGRPRNPAGRMVVGQEAAGGEIGTAKSVYVNVPEQVADTL